MERIDALKQLAAKVTERDRSVLSDLDWLNNFSQYPTRWARPMDIGGSNGSHHSNTLRKLERLGLVQSKQRGWPDPEPGEPEPKWKPGKWNRGAKLYRVTDAGRALIAMEEAK